MTLEQLDQLIGGEHLARLDAENRAADLRDAIEQLTRARSLLFPDAPPYGETLLPAKPAKRPRKVIAAPAPPTPDESKRRSSGSGRHPSPESEKARGLILGLLRRSPKGMKLADIFAVMEDEGITYKTMRNIIGRCPEITKVSRAVYALASTNGSNGTKQVDHKEQPDKLGGHDVTPHGNIYRCQNCFEERKFRHEFTQVGCEV